MLWVLILAIHLLSRPNGKSTLPFCSLKQRLRVSQSQGRPVYRKPVLKSSFCSRIASPVHSLACGPKANQAGIKQVCVRAGSRASISCVNPGHDPRGSLHSKASLPSFLRKEAAGNTLTQKTMRASRLPMFLC